jgi:hypothetical protein
MIGPEAVFCLKEDTVLCQFSGVHLFYCLSLKNKCNQYFK